MKIEYKGFITEEEIGDNYDALYVCDTPIAQLISNDMEDYGEFLTVKYFISDKEKTFDELQENEVRKLSGDVSAEYSDVYSECTGYLWTNEELEVGGHDLLNELRSNVGRYVYLIIEYYKNEQDIPS